MKKVTSTLTYQKGAWVLHMLREQMGATNFMKGIRSYYKKYFNANATTSDFKYEMEQASGQDLTPFFHQWLYQEGMPAIKGQWSWDGKKKEIRITLEQTQGNTFAFPLDIGILADGKQALDIKNIILSSKQTTVTFPLESKPTSVVLDPKTNLLATFDFRQK
jgi:aminopeptidase N